MSMDLAKIAMVGCGGMGRRHLTGIAALYKSDFRNIDLVAVCDINRQNADDLAAEAEAALGVRPRVFYDASEMARAMPEITGADVCTDTGSHHRVGSLCLELGFHIQIEKPIAITQRGCELVIATAKQHGKILSVAENYRRDPINRLGKALMNDGAIGTPQLMMETSIGGADNLFITPWRHQKFYGTIALDAGVHNADMIQYYMGDAATVFGEGRIFEKLRYKRNAAGPGGFYAKWADKIPDVVEATGEDSLFAYIKFESGAIGQWIFHHGGHGKGLGHRYIYGSKGCLQLPGDRNGRPITLYHDNGKEYTNEAVLDFAPSYKLSPVAAQLFGGERVPSYSFPFVETDAKILALEYHEFGECITRGVKPEVTGEVGRRDVALVNAAFESGVVGRAVTIAEVESLAVSEYQADIDEHFKLV